MGDSRQFHRLQEVLCGLKKKGKVIAARKTAIDEARKLLDLWLQYISSDHERVDYDASSVIADLVIVCDREIEFNSERKEKLKNFLITRDAFDMAYPVILQVVKVGLLEASDGGILDWYCKVCRSEFREDLEDSVLSCLHEFLTHVSIVDIPDQLMLRMWKALWGSFVVTSRGKNVTKMIRYTDCLFILLQMAKQTVLASKPQELISQILSNLCLPVVEGGIWSNRVICQCVSLIGIIRLLLRDWGFTLREQLLPSIESLVKCIISHLDFSNTIRVSEPWSTVTTTCTREEQGWLLMEEFFSLSSVSSPTTSSIASCTAESLVSKYAKIATSMQEGPPSSSYSNCRLVATSLLYEFASSISCERVKSSPERKRKREKRILPQLIDMQLVDIVSERTGRHYEKNLPVKFSLFALQTLSLVFEEGGELLGEHVDDLVRRVNQATNKLNKEELYAPLARLLASAEKCRQEYGEEKTDSSENEDLWNRAMAWSHVHVSFPEASRLLIICDGVRDLSTRDSSFRSIRLSQLVEVVRNASVYGQSFLDLLSYIVTQCEWNERMKCFPYAKDFDGIVEWRFRKELAHLIIGLFSSVDISSFLIALCSFHPYIQKAIDVPPNVLANPSKMLNNMFDEVKKKRVEDDKYPPEALVIPVVQYVKDQLENCWKNCEGDDMEGRVRVWRLVQSIYDAMKRLHKDEMDKVIGLQLLHETTSTWMVDNVNTIATEVLSNLCCPDIADTMDEEILNGLQSRVEEVPSLYNTILHTRKCSIDDDLIMHLLQWIKSRPSLVFSQSLSDSLAKIIMRLSPQFESLVDVHESIVSFSHLLPSRSNALLLSKMCNLIEEDTSGHCHWTVFYHDLLAFFHKDPSVRSALLEGESEAMQSITKVSEVMTRLSLEVKTGDFTMGSVSAVQACLHPFNWENHHILIQNITQWPQLMKMCARFIPHFPSFLEEAAAAFDVPRGEEMQEVWDERLSQMSMLCSRLRRGEENMESEWSGESSTYTSSTDSIQGQYGPFGMALLLPRSHWDLLFPLWDKIADHLALKALIDYSKRCYSIGLYGRIISLIAHLSKFQSGNSQFFLVAEPLAEKALQEIIRMKDDEQLRSVGESWRQMIAHSSFSGTCSPSQIQMYCALGVEKRREIMGDDGMEIVEGNTERMFDYSSILAMTDYFWKEAQSRRKELLNDKNIHAALIESFRVVHEAGLAPSSSSSLLPYFGPLASLKRNDFTAESFSYFLRLHIHLWFFSRRFEDATADDIGEILQVLSVSPLSPRNEPSEDDALIDLHFSQDLVGNILKLAINGKETVWKILLQRLTRVMQLVGLSVEVCPFLVSLCDAEQACSVIFKHSSDSFNCRSPHPDLPLIIMECFSVTGIALMWKTAMNMGDIAFNSLKVMSEKSLEAGVIPLSRLALDIALDICYGKLVRTCWLFNPSFSIPPEIEESFTRSIIARGDADAASSLPPSIQSTEEIRQILAESRHAWSLSESKDARAAMEEYETECLLKLNQWGDIVEQPDTMHKSMSGVFNLLQRRERAGEDAIFNIRESIEKRLASSRDFLSVSMRNDARKLAMVATVESFNRGDDEEYEYNDGLSKSIFDDVRLLKANVHLATWERKKRENKSIAKSVLESRVHDTVLNASQYLDNIHAFKPAVRLLSHWTNSVMTPELKRLTRLEEAKVHARMGEDHVALHVIQMIREASCKSENTLNCKLALAEADIIGEKGVRTVDTIKSIDEVLNAIRGRTTREEAQIVQEGHSRLFDMSANLLSATEKSCDGKGFRMKIDAIRSWEKQIKDMDEGRLEMDKKKKVKLQRELQCEVEEVQRIRYRVADMALQCTCYGLQALRNAPMGSKRATDILFPLLDVLFRHAREKSRNGDKYAEMIKDHIITSNISHWVSAVGHLVGHIFTVSPITRTFEMLLVKMVIQYPFHTLPRLMFYYDCGGVEQDSVRAILDAAATKDLSIKDKVEDFRQCRVMFREFTVANMNDKTCFLRGRFEGKDSYQIQAKMGILQFPVYLARIPMPTLHLDITADQRNFLYITSINQYCEKADGLSAPKILTVQTSDGNIHKIICKAEDVRQDAMVEHLFQVVNNILSRNDPKEHQPLRTYKVTPLDATAGLIEFCENTQSLKELLCGADRESGLHKSVYPDDWTAKKAIEYLAKGVDKVQAFTTICQNMRPVFRHFFYRNYSTAVEWSHKINEYRRSLAQWSIICYIVGLGDRHASNVLFEPKTARFVHIDLGMILEYSKRSLPIPERVPFRLTRDLVDPLVGDHLNGKFTKIAVSTLKPLREKSTVLIGVASVLLRETMTNFSDADDNGTSFVSLTAIGRLKDKLNGTDAFDAPETPDQQVRRLIIEATDVHNLATIFHGWMPFL